MKQKNRAKAQIDLFDEIIVDNFAGGGGASTGIELAAGRPVTIAINHDPDAILLHKTNHPYTQHYQEDVWSVDPRAVCGGRKVGLAWFSPDCKHFSKAKGAALVDRKIRGLAWIVLKWAALVRPRVIMLENVEEFQTWGPVRKGKPVKKKAGQTFRKWKSQLAGLGYQIDHRELVMADYGAPTTRKRFCLIARCDGKPIVWPERTHAPRDSEEVKRGMLKPWHSAAEVIDWSIPAYSIFDSKKEIKRKYGVNAVRPLADNTMRRVIRGVDKFTIRSGRPFLVPIGYGERKGQAPRVHDLDDPLPTVVSTAKQSLCAPVLCQVNHAGGDRSQNVQDTLPTITAKHGYGVSESILAPITLTNTGASVGGSAGEPVHTIRTGGGGQILAAANLIQYHTEQNENVRANELHKPLPTADASNRYALTTAQLVEYYSTGRGIDVEEPMHTVTSHDREAVAMAHIVKFKGNDLGQHPEQPLQTVTASAGEFAACHVYLAKATGDNFGRWPLVRNLLNRYCGYSLAENEVLLLRIGGKLYFIADILLRMLQPRELYNAMGFPPDYVIDRDYLGNEYKKNKQVARCGNAVCPPLATALVRANLPEWCGGAIGTMAELEKVVAV